MFIAGIVECGGDLDSKGEDTSDYLGGGGGSLSEKWNVRR